MSRCVLLFALAFTAVVLATPSLVLELQGSSVVDGSVGINVTTTLTNTGDGPIQLFNDPRGLLSTLPVDIFTIAKEDGATPDFVGIRVKYLPTAAFTSNATMALTTLAPGQSLRVEHAVSDAYDFSTTGTGRYTIALRDATLFSLTAEGEILPLRARSARMIYTFHVSGTARSRRQVGSSETQDCESWQKRAIEGAIPISQFYVANALSELAQKGHSGADYKRWFGAPSEHRLATVASHFEALAANNFTDYTYVCNTDYCARQPGVYAYVYPDQYGKVHLCDQFFRAPVGGHDSRASTIVHESSHFTRNGGTQDHAYGERLAEALARSYPELAVMNADNHEYYAASAHDDDMDDTTEPAQVYLGEKSLAA